MSRLMTTMAILIGIAGWSMRANAEGWHVCNRTAEDLRIAIAYHDGANGWLTEGWWTLRQCGGCAYVMPHSKTDGTNVFLHATTRGGALRVGGEGRFCVSDPAKGAPPWTGRSGKTCGAGYVSATFQKHVVDTDKKYTTNITGNASGGRRCID